MPDGRIPTAVVALGCPTGDDGKPTARQRWRVEQALRCASAYNAELVVFTGGAVKNRFVEAETMDTYARSLANREPPITQERAATNTWENVTYSHPLVAEAQRVVLVSNTWHAKRALRYWLRQFPDEADRVSVGPELTRNEPWTRRPVSFVYNNAISAWDLVASRFT